MGTSIIEFCACWLRLAISAPSDDEPASWTIPYDELEALADGISSNVRHSTVWIHSTEDCETGNWGVWRQTPLHLFGEWWPA